jgi:general secretion pathway protein C
MDRIDWITQNPKISFLVNIFLGTAILITVLIFALNIISKVYKPRDAKKSFYLTNETIKHERKSLEQYSDILKNNPFGFHAGALRPLTVSTDKAPAFFDIKLVGTISGNPFYSYAVFLGKDGKQEFYKKGDSVFERYLIKKIEKNKVVVEDGGVLTDIPISETSSADRDTAPASREMSDNVMSSGEGEYIIDQDYLQQAIDNPHQIMTDARLIPNMINNRQEGFILKEVKKGGIYDSMGLRNADTLLRINDYDISNPANALQAFTALKGMDRVRLDIIRAGAKTTLTYQIR